MRVLFEVIAMWFKKTIVTTLALSIILITFSGCFGYKSFEGKRPCDQPNTKWASEDRSIYFEIKDKCYGVGSIFKNGTKVEFYFTNDAGIGIHLYSLNVLSSHIESDEEEYEYWIGSFEMNEFVATVKKTTYYEVGQKIKFYKLEE